MVTDGFSRRKFVVRMLQGAGALVAAYTILHSLFGDRKKKDAVTAPSSAEGFVACPQGEVFSEESIKARAALKYVEKSPIASRTCANCKLYKAAAAPSPCGGCLLFAGAVNPKGYCASWYQRM